MNWCTMVSQQLLQFLHSNFTWFAIINEDIITPTEQWFSKLVTDEMLISRARFIQRIKKRNSSSKEANFKQFHTWGPTSTSCTKFSQTPDSVILSKQFVYTKIGNVIYWVIGRYFKYFPFFPAPILFSFQPRLSP